MKNRKRYIMTSLIVCLAPLVGVGLGWFTGETEYKNSKIKTHTVDAEFLESRINDDMILPGDKIVKKISIKPKSTTPSFIRVKIDKSWISSGGESNLPAENIKVLYDEDEIVLKNTKSNVQSKILDKKWYEGNDEYLYYIDLVDDKTSEIHLIKGIEFLGNVGGIDTNIYQGKNLDFKVNMEIVQAKNNAFKSAWNLKDIDEEALINKLESLSERLESK